MSDAATMPPATAAGDEQIQALVEYCLRLGDTALILGHRLGEWCGHGPALEEDMALVNISLDQLGTARALFAYAGEIEGKGRDEDAIAFLRDPLDYRHVLLAEQPNEDFAYTIVRQLLISAFQVDFYQRLTASTDERLAAIGAKAVKEAAYHLRHAGQWTIRLGDGTEESHRKAQAALDELWCYTGELFETDRVEEALIAAGIAVDPGPLKALWDERIDGILAEATLTRPEDGWMQTGGRQGRHSEYLGFILTDLQYMQRTYPGATW